ncbi:MAG: helix-turn-helix domain-containing protein [Streptosporangiales bacterium]|nr:helix-turn-helix domain-containing protein [Streptosporangiales bacterium]
MADTTKRAPGVQSIDRAASILRSFSAKTPTLGISDIARKTGLSTSTTHRLLVAMQHNQLVRQTADRRYALGPLLLQLARSGAVAPSLREAALPAMTALRDAEEETVGLHMLLPDDERVVVDQVESHHPLRRTYTELGVPIPLPYGAPGKILVAFLEPDRKEAILRRPLRKVTPATMVDAGALRVETEEARRTGYALSYAERTPGIHTVAAAIFDHTGAVVGCLSLTGPEIRMPAARLRTLGPRVRASAWAVSELLGARDELVRARHAADDRDQAS